MKILFWNARGVANHPTRLVLKNICVSHKPDIVLIAEPWMNLDAFPKMFWTQLGLRPFSVNSCPNLAPNLWCLCRDVLNPTVIVSFPQQVSFFVVVQGRSFSPQLSMLVLPMPVEENFGMNFFCCSSCIMVLGAS